MKKGNTLLWSNLLDSVPDPVFIIDTEGQIVAWNQAMEKISGVSSQQALGEGDYFHALPFYGRRCPMLANLVLDAALENNYAGDFWREDEGYYRELLIPASMERKSDLYYWIKASPVRDEAGQIIAAMQIFRDVTAIKEADKNSQLARQQAEEAFEQLMAAQEELRQKFDELQDTERVLRKQLDYNKTIVDNLNEMFYTYDQDVRLTFINRKSIDFMGYHPEELIGIISKKFFPAEDWEWIEREIKSRLLRDSQASYVMPILHRDGSTRYLKTNSASITEEGRVVGGMVLAEDITEEIKAIQALRDSENNLRRITDNMLDFIDELDEEGRIVYASPSHLTVMGYWPETIMGMQFRQLLHPDDLRDSMHALKSIKQTGEARVSQHRCRHADGHYVWIETVGSPILQDGKVSGVILSSRDITVRKQLEQELRFVSVHDGLTRLYNRCYFEEEMERLEGGRHNPVGVMIADLDGLKLVNDTLGHEAGDRLLVQTANILHRSFRQGDVIARVGGDEFAVLLPNTSYSVLEQVAKRIQTMIDGYNASSPQLPLSISIGMAVRVSNSISLRDTYKEADNAMYRVKLYSGRTARTAVVKTMIKALEARDFMIEGHGERMQNLVVQLGTEIGLSDSMLSTLGLLARYHDIGKVGVPDRILFKEAALNEEEYQEIKRHSEVGQRIALASPEMAPLADLILKHHEWWNGQGYPLGLAGEDIPLECRILALADAYDAMTSYRPYRQALSPEEARREINRCAGTQFDPVLATRFLEILG